MSMNPSTPSEERNTAIADVMTAAPAFFRIGDVMRITALSRTTVYRRIAEGMFPPPVHLGGRACGWTPAALQAWINDPGAYRAPCQSDERPTKTEPNVLRRSWPSSTSASSRPTIASQDSRVSAT